MWLFHVGSSRPRWEPVWLSLSFQVSHQLGRKDSLNVARVRACKHWEERREKRCWERVSGRGSYTTRPSLHSQERLKAKTESKKEKAFNGLSENDFKASENTCIYIYAREREHPPLTGTKVRHPLPFFLLKFYKVVMAKVPKVLLWTSECTKVRWLKSWPRSFGYI